MPRKGEGKLSLLTDQGRTITMPKKLKKVAYTAHLKGTQLEPGRQIVDIACNRYGVTFPHFPICALTTTWEGHWSITDNSFPPISRPYVYGVSHQRSRGHSQEAEFVGHVVFSICLGSSDYECRCASSSFRPTTAKRQCCCLLGGPGLRHSGKTIFLTIRG